MTSHQIAEIPSIVIRPLKQMEALDAGVGVGINARFRKYTRHLRAVPICSTSPAGHILSKCLSRGTEVPHRLLKEMALTLASQCLPWSHPVSHPEYCGVKEVCLFPDGPNKITNFVGRKVEAGCGHSLSSGSLPQTVTYFLSHVGHLSPTHPFEDCTVGENLAL